jgi:hypothetical protein
MRTVNVTEYKNDFIYRQGLVVPCVETDLPFRKRRQQQWKPRQGSKPESAEKLPTSEHQ